MMRSIEARAATIEAAIRSALEELGCHRDQVEVEVLRQPEAGGLLGFGRKDAVVRVSGPIAPPAESLRSGEADNNPAAEYTAVKENTTDFPAVEERTAGSAQREDVADNEDAADAVSSPLTTEGAVEAWYAYLKEPQKTCTEVARHFLTAVLECMRLKSGFTLQVHEDEENLLVEIDGEDCGILIGRRGATLNALQYMLILLTHRHAPEKKFVQLDIGGYHRRRKNGLADLARKTAERALATGNAYELNPMRAPDRRIVHETLADFRGVITYSEGQGRDRFVVIDLEDYDDVTFE